MILNFGHAENKRKNAIAPYNIGPLVSRPSADAMAFSICKQNWPHTSLAKAVLIKGYFSDPVCPPVLLAFPAGLWLPLALWERFSSPELRPSPLVPRCCPCFAMCSLNSIVSVAVSPNQTEDLSKPEL